MRYGLLAGGMLVSRDFQSHPAYSSHLPYTSGKKCCALLLCCLLAEVIAVPKAVDSWAPRS